MASCWLSLARRQSGAVVCVVTLLLTGCGGDSGNNEAALGPGSGPSAAPPAPINLPPTPSGPPVIPGSPRLPLPDNPPVFVRALEQPASGEPRAVGACYSTALSRGMVTAEQEGDPRRLDSGSANVGPAAEIELRGQVAAVDYPAATWQVVGQPIRTTAQTQYVGAAGVTLMPGLNVLVRGGLDAAGVLYASEFRVLAGSGGNDWCIAGPVAEVDSTTQRMRIGAVWLTPPSASTATAMTWTVGMSVVTEGTGIANDNSAAASSVARVRPAEVLIEGPITALAATTGSVAVMNVPVQTNARTAFVVASMPDVDVGFAALRVGDWVRVLAGINNGALDGAALVVVPALTGTEAARLHIPATAVTALQPDTWEVLGMSVMTSAATTFRLGGETLSGDVFFVRAEPAATMTFEGTFDGSSLLAHRLIAQPRVSP